MCISLTEDEQCSTAKIICPRQAVLLIQPRLCCPRMLCTRQDYVSVGLLSGGQQVVWWSAGDEDGLQVHFTKKQAL